MNEGNRTCWEHVHRKVFLSTTCCPHQLEELTAQAEAAQDELAEIEPWAAESRNLTNHRYAAMPTPCPRKGIEQSKERRDKDISRMLRSVQELLGLRKLDQSSTRYLLRAKIVLPQRLCKKLAKAKGVMGEPVLPWSTARTRSQLSKPMLLAASRVQGEILFLGSGQWSCLRRDVCT